MVQVVPDCVFYSFSTRMCFLNLSRDVKLYFAAFFAQRQITL